MSMPPITPPSPHGPPNYPPPGLPAHGSSPFQPGEPEIHLERDTTPQVPVRIEEHKPIKLGLIIFHGFKLLCLVAISPIALPVAGLVFLGRVFGGGVPDLKEDARKVFKPLTNQFYGISAGWRGITLKERKQEAKTERLEARKREQQEYEEMRKAYEEMQRQEKQNIEIEPEKFTDPNEL